MYYSHHIVHSCNSYGSTESWVPRRSSTHSTSECSCPCLVPDLIWTHRLSPALGLALMITHAFSTLYVTTCGLHLYSACMPGCTSRMNPMPANFNILFLRSTENLPHCATAATHETWDVMDSSDFGREHGDLGRVRNQHLTSIGPVTCNKPRDLQYTVHSHLGSAMLQLHL
jgi:hypothetical protein